MHLIKPSNNGNYCTIHYMLSEVVMFMKGCYILLSKTHINVTLYAIATYHTKYTLLNDEY